MASAVERPLTRSRQTGRGYTKNPRIPVSRAPCSPASINQNTKPVIEKKVIMLGGSGAGKSSICLRITNNAFSFNHEVTLNPSFYSLASEQGDYTVRLQIWDTFGQEKFHSFTTNYFRGVNAAVAVYDITEEKSLRSMKFWLNCILNTYKGQDVVPILVVVGNKEDLDQSRVVDKDDVESYARSIGASYMEASALGGTGIEKIFTFLALKLSENHANQGNGSTSRSTINLTSSYPTNTSHNGGCCS